MSGVTPRFGLPFPLYGEVTNVPAQIEALADGMDAFFAEENSAVAAVHEKIRCGLAGTSNLAIPNNVVTTLTFNTQPFDNDNMLDVVTNASTITVRTDGMYLITATVVFAANSVGNREIILVRNGTDIFSGIKFGAVGSGTSSFRMSTTGLQKFSEGDTIVCRVSHQAGASLPVIDRTFQAIRMSF